MTISVRHSTSVGMIPARNIAGIVTAAVFATIANSTELWLGGTRIACTEALAVSTAPNERG